MQKNTKRFVTISIAAMLSVAVIGCGNSDKASEATTEERIQPIVLSDSSNAKFLEDLRIFTDLKDVLVEEKTEVKDDDKKEDAAPESTTEGSEESSTGESEDGSKDSSEDSSEDTSSEASTEKAEETDTDTNVLKEVDKLTEGFSLGTTTDHIYNNSYFGLSYPLDETWQIASRKEMIYRDGYEPGTEDETSLAAIMQGATQFTDLSCVISDGNANIIDSIINVKGYEKYFYGHKTARKYYYTKLYEYFAGKGYKNILVSKDDITIGGEEFPALDVQMDYLDNTYFIKVIFSKKDHFMNMFIVTSKGDNIDDILLKPLTYTKDSEEGTDASNSTSSTNDGADATGDSTETTGDSTETTGDSTETTGESTAESTAESTESY